MRSTNKGLMADEKIIYRVRPHWIIYFSTFVWVIVAVLLLIYTPDTAIGSITFIKDFPLGVIAGMVALLLALYSALSAYIVYVTSEYIITNRRVLMKSGLIHRVSVDILLQRIESLKVNQSIPGRILSYGAITISGTGGSRDPFYNIPAPYAFRENVQEQIEATTTGNPANR